MLAPRVLVLRAPGTNCDYETARGFERAGGIPRRVHVRSLAERPARSSAFPAASPTVTTSPAAGSSRSSCGHDWPTC